MADNKISAVSVPKSIKKSSKSMVGMLKTTREMRGEKKGNKKI